MQYSEELIEEIKNANDIVEVVSQYVTLKRNGKNYFGICPFHKESSASFSVSPNKQFFHCFGCQMYIFTEVNRCLNNNYQSKS